MFWRYLGLQTATKAERYATFWLALMFFATLAGMFLLRPIRNQFGVARGVEGMPELYTLTLLATVALVLPFWSLANRMSSRRFVPIALHLGSLALVVLAAAFWWIGDYQWQQQPWRGERCATFRSAEAQQRPFARAGCRPSGVPASSFSQSPRCSCA